MNRPIFPIRMADNNEKLCFEIANLAARVESYFRWPLIGLAMSLYKVASDFVSYSLRSPKKRKASRVEMIRETLLASLPIDLAEELKTYVFAKQDYPYSFSEDLKCEIWKEFCAHPFAGGWSLALAKQTVFGNVLTQIEGIHRIDGDDYKQWNENLWSAFQNRAEVSEEHVLYIFCQCLVDEMMPHEVYEQYLRKECRKLEKLDGEAIP